MNATPTRPAFPGELEVATSLGIPKAPKVPHFTIGQYGACFECGGLGETLEPSGVPGTVTWVRAACKPCGGNGWDPSRVAPESRAL